MPNRVLCDSSGGSYSYDGNGNWTGLTGNGNTYTFTYDAENRLDYYKAPSMSSAYSYNGMGLRVAESDSGSGEHDLINDGSGPGSPLLVDHNISARTVAHVYTPGLEQRDGLNGALHLMGVDALGSVRAFINDDSGQAVTDTQGYYGYGITRSRTGSDWMPFGFAGAEGYQTDPNELMLLGNREYHPFTGRFLTRDPAGAGDNDYEYTDDNPLRKVDPSGLAGIAPGSVWAGSGPRGQDPAGQALNDYIQTTWYFNTLKNGSVVSSIPFDWTYEMLSFPAFAGLAGPGSASASATHPTTKFTLPPVIIHLGIDGKLAAIFDATWSPGLYLKLGGGGASWGVYNTLGLGGGPEVYMGTAVEFGIGFGSLSAFQGSGNSIGADILPVGLSADYNSGYVGVSGSLGFGTIGGVTFNKTATDIYPLGHF